MKLDLMLPDGTQIKFEWGPMDNRKFNAVCRLLSFGLYVALTQVIVSTNDFFALLWFYLLSVGAVCALVYYEKQE